MLTFKKTAPWLACSVLVACGGSSNVSDNPVGEPLAITTTNYLTVAQEVLLTSFSLVDTSEVLVYGAKVSTLPRPLNHARQQLTQLPQRVLNIGRLVAGTVYDDTALCTDGGTVTVSFDDRDNNLVVSAGDVLTETFTNCVESGETANGTLRFAFNTLTGDLNSTEFSASLTLSFEVFRITSAAGSVLANGTVTLNTVSTGLYAQQFAMNAPSYREEVNIGGAVTSRTLTDFHTQETIEPALLDYAYSAQVNGTLTSSVFGGQSVVIANITPFSGLGAQNYPPNGQVLVSGAASSVRITAVSDSTVFINLDTNGDGASDLSETHLWSEFL